MGAWESDQTVRIFREKGWNFIGEFSLRDDSSQTVEGLEKDYIFSRGSLSRHKAKKA